MEKKHHRLFVLCNDKFKDNPVYACVQGGHAVAQYFIDNIEDGNNIYDLWLNDTIVYLWFPEKEFWDWQQCRWPFNNMYYKGLPVFEWFEPDQNYIMTSAAVWEKDIIEHPYGDYIMKQISRLQLVK